MNVSEAFFKMQTEDAASETIEIEAEETPSLYEIYKDEPNVVIRDDGRLVLAFLMDGRFVVVQEKATYQCQRFNLLFLNKYQKGLWDEWWSYRKQLDSKHKREEAERSGMIILPGTNGRG